MEKGETVRVYQDPITCKDFEGYAKLIEPRPRKRDIKGLTETWFVKFEDGAKVERTINLESKAESEKIQKMKKEFQEAIQSVKESAEKAEKIYGKRVAPSMRRMYQKDAKDLHRVYKLWSQGRYNEADEVAWKMDTNAREHIPDSVWNDIQRKIGTK